MTDTEKTPFWTRRGALALVIVASASVAVGVTALLTNIFEHKVEEQKPFVRVVDVGEDDTDPAKWGLNWPAEYDGYKRTAIHTSTRFGGHAGSEALPEEKIEREPWLKRMFLGYAFSIDYRDRRGHAFMLTDQESTKRLSKPQSGSCLHCHASIMPLYRELGQGDAMKGFEKTYTYSYQDLDKKLHESGHAHPVSCVDCHDPKTMALRVTRPGFIKGIASLAASDSPTPAIPSITEWRTGKKSKAYDPNVDATRNELRSFVCGQCHVEYYCSTKMPLTFPWGKGLKADDIETFWNETKFPDGATFSDYTHKETDAPILKAQHPEFELWSQGIHAQSGVSCADCHMPYMRDGASKVSDHWVRSPLININRACQSCHKFGEDEMKRRVDVIQSRNYALMERGGKAIVALIDGIVAAKGRGAPAAMLDAARGFQRKAQWRLDFIAAENSMGFHAPQEAARVLAEAIDYARQGQLALLDPNAPLPAATPAGDAGAPDASVAPSASAAVSAAPSAKRAPTPVPSAAPKKHPALEESR